MLDPDRPGRQQRQQLAFDPFQRVTINPGEYVDNFGDRERLES